MRDIEYASANRWVAQLNPIWKSLAEKVQRLSAERLGSSTEQDDASANAQWVEILNGKYDLDEHKEYAAVLSTILVSGIKLPIPTRRSMNEFVAHTVRSAAQPMEEIPPKWYHDMGEFEKNPTVAATWYQCGYRAQPTYVQNWLCALGCYDDDDDIIETIIDEFRRFLKTDPEGGRRVTHFLGSRRANEVIRGRRAGRGFQYLVENGILE